MHRFSLTCLGLIALGSAATAQVPKVVTDIPITQSLVAQVMGDLGTPAIVMGQGGNAHSYQMRLSEARALDQADVVIWIGPEMTPWLNRAINASNKERTQLALLHSDGTHTRSFPEGDDHDHHDHDHADGHTHEGLDPHAWLDPRNASVWLDNIATQLSAVDPDNAPTYRANADRARKEVEALDTTLSTELGAAADKPFVVYHDAYGYLADRYNLKNAGSIATGDATTPGAAHLSALRKNLQNDGIVCAFPEAGHDQRTMKQVIDGTPVRFGDALDPEGTAIALGPNLYTTLISNMSQTLIKCLAQK